MTPLELVHMLCILTAIYGKGDLREVSGTPGFISGNERLMGGISTTQKSANSRPINLTGVKVCEFSHEVITFVWNVTLA